MRVIIEHDDSNLRLEFDDIATVHLTGEDGEVLPMTDATLLDTLRRLPEARPGSPVN